MTRIVRNAGIYGLPYLRHLTPLHSATSKFAILPILIGHMSPTFHPQDQHREDSRPTCKCQGIVQERLCKLQEKDKS